MDGKFATELYSELSYEFMQCMISEGRRTNPLTYKYRDQDFMYCAGGEI